MYDDDDDDAPETPSAIQLFRAQATPGAALVRRGLSSIDSAPREQTWLEKLRGVRPDPNESYRKAEERMGIMRRVNKDALGIMEDTAQSRVRLEAFSNALAEQRARGCEIAIRHERAEQDRLHQRQAFLKRKRIAEIGYDIDYARRESELQRIRDTNALDSAQARRDLVDLEGEIERAKRAHTEDKAFGTRASSTFAGAAGMSDRDIEEIASGIVNEAAAGSFEPDAPERHFHPLAAATYFKALERGDSEPSARVAATHATVRAIKLDLSGQKRMTRGVAQATYEAAVEAKRRFEQAAARGDLGDMLGDITGGRGSYDPV